MKTRLSRVIYSMLLLVSSLLIVQWVGAGFQTPGAKHVQITREAYIAITAPFGACEGEEDSIQTQPDMLNFLFPTPFLLAWESASSGMWDRALELLESSYKHTQRKIDALSLGNLNAYLGNTGQAYHWWREADAAYSLASKVEQCAISGEEERAQMYAHSATSVVQEMDIKTYPLLLTYYSSRGSEAEFDFALQGFLRSATRLDRDYRLLMVLGDAFQTRNRLSQALEIYEKALALDPHNERTLYKAGLAAFRRNDYELTRYYLQTCLELYENCVKAKLLLGHIALEQGHIEQAFEWYRQYDRLVVSLPLMAKIRFEQGRLGEARNLIERAIKLDATQKENHGLLAQICYALDDKLCQIKAYRAIIELDPENQAAKDSLSQLGAQP